MTGDRMSSDVFQITQEFLSNMLGVRREAVTLSAKNLQQSELIRYTRGKYQFSITQVWKPFRVVVISLLKRNMRIS